MGYIFDPDALHAIALHAVGKPPDEMIRTVADGLERAYPGHVDTRQPFILSLFGGTTGMIKVLHASVTEYVLIYGSAVGTTGFSGRYLMEIHDSVLCGEMSTFLDNRPLERELFRPGDHAVLPRGRAKGWSIGPETWMLEYGRGLVPSGLAFGVGDALFSAMDPPTLLGTLWIYGKLTLRELLRGKV